MKKIVLLPLLLLIFTACSTDDADILLDEDQAELSPEVEKTELKSCMYALKAETNIDVSGGFGNPVIQFIATTEKSNSAVPYRITLEVETLDDCEDFTGATGATQSFVQPGYTQVLNTIPYTVTMNPGDLPATCYKWRFVYEGYVTGKDVVVCYTASQWYESPLF